MSCFSPSFSLSLTSFLALSLFFFSAQTPAFASLAFFSPTQNLPSLHSIFLSTFSSPVPPAATRMFVCLTFLVSLSLIVAFLAIEQLFFSSPYRYSPFPDFFYLVPLR